jgi:cytochrome c2
MTAAAEPRPGLALKLEGGSKSPFPDARVSRLAALFVPAGSPPSSFLPAGSFRAMFEGYLEAELRDDFAFSLEGRGTAALSIDGKPVLEAKGEDLSKAPPATVELRQGRNRISLDYRSPPAGDAALRLLWSSADFASEPVPARVLSHDAGDPLLASRLLLRTGRALASERRCFRCHVGPESRSAPAAPELAGVGGRLRGEWLARSIDDPRAVRTDAAMPRVFRSDGREIDSRAANVAALLASLGSEGGRSDDSIPPGPKRVEKGRQCFRDLGCLGCHSLAERGGSAASGRRPLGGLAFKWRPAALGDFLLGPDRRYPWIRMPDFKLAPEEAEELASFLLASTPSKSEPAAPPHGPPPDPARGRKLIEESGCLACHEAPPGFSNRFRAPALGAIAARGCLAADPAGAGAAPDFRLSAEERAALAAFLDARSSAGEEPAAEFAAREVEALRCGACHARDGGPDGLSGLADELKALGTDLPPAAAAPGGEGPDGKTLDQTRPDLTWTGEKLRPEWMAGFVAGRNREPIRPWLHARMPAFPSRADLLARGLAAEHGFPPAVPVNPPADREMSSLGKKLLGREGGFGCTSCHDLGTTPAQGAFEAKGINFIYTCERLRKPFFHRWMMSPLRVAPETRMPQFADPEGRSPFTDVLGGDARQQFEAIWHYLLAGRALSLGE